MNDLARQTSQRKNPVFRFSRHALYNLSRPEKSLQLMAPLAKEAGGHGACKATSDPQAPPATVFAGTDDPDYLVLLAAIRAAKDHLDTIKRFDMPGFRPDEHYVREMKRYGVLPEKLAVDDPIDVYRTDRAYWRLLWYRPVEK